MSRSRLWRFTSTTMLAIFVATTHGQSAPQPSTQSLAFAAASIKRNTSAAARRNFGMEPGGRFIMVNDSIRQILAMAYTETPEVRGIPAWVTQERYDINASAGHDASRDEIVVMLRTLLADRLHFRAHVENTEQEADALKLRNSSGTLGPRMRKSPVDCVALTAALAMNNVGLAESLRGDNPAGCTQRVTTGSIESHGMTMTQLASTIRGRAGRPVVNETGLSGGFDFVLEFTNDVASSVPSIDALPSIFTALQEQLGLTVAPIRVTVPTLVVDRIDRPDPD